MIICPPNLSAVAVGKDILIFNLSTDSTVENEGDSYGNIDVEIQAAIKEAKSTKIHTFTVTIRYRYRHNTDNWSGRLVFDGRYKEIDEDSCISFCESLFEQEIYWKYNDSKMKEFVGQLITDLISGKYIKLS